MAMKTRSGEGANPSMTKPAKRWNPFATPTDLRTVRNFDKFADSLHEVIGSDAVLRVRCSCFDFQRASFCKHVGNLLVNNEDAELASGLVEVPMWSKPYLPIIAGVDHPNDAGFRRVGVATGQEGDDKVGVEFVGFILPSQGRQAIRLLLNDWLTELPFTTGPLTCSSPHHVGFKSLRTKPGLSARLEQREIYSIFASGWCYSCWTADGVPDV